MLGEKKYSLLKSTKACRETKLFCDSLSQMQNSEREFPLAGEWSHMLSFGTTPYTPGEEQVHNSSDIDEVLLSSRRKFSNYSNEPNLLPTKIGCQPVSKILFLGLPICPQLVSRFQTPDKLSVHQSY